MALKYQITKNIEFPKMDKGTVFIYYPQTLFYKAHYACGTYIVWAYQASKGLFKKI